VLLLSSLACLLVTFATTTMLMAWFLPSLDDGGVGAGDRHRNKLKTDWFDRETYFKSSQQHRRSNHERNNGVESDWVRGPWAIFYNMYVPVSDIDSEVTAAIEIIREQMGQIAESPACSSQQPVTLYYNLIGNARAIDESAMTKLCHEQSPNLDCQRLHVYESGSEEVTLRELHGFCTRHPDYRVSYLHPKGSFHVSEKNTHWRRLLTAAAVSPDCVNPPNATCNLCGLQFFTQFTFFVPGNMFTAHCAYVRQLLPLVNGVYRRAREAAVGELMLLKLRNQLRASLLRDQRDFLGLDRYSDEHWIGSHPDVVPCDMDPSGDIFAVYHGTLTEKDFEWGMGPRHKGICGGINDERQSIVRNQPDLRRRELLLLPGLLTKWFALYGRAPKPDSWVWSFFPDAEYWLEGIQKHGAQGVKVFTDRYRFSADGTRLQTAFAPNTTNYNATTAAAAVKDLGRYDNFNTNLTIDPSSPSPHFALFYHIAIPNARDGSLVSENDLPDALDMVKHQLEIVTSSFVTSQSNPVSLFYSVAGHQASDPSSESSQIVHTLMAKLCRNAHLYCRPLLQFEQNYEGETLRQLHRFCHRYPSYRVSYFHNQAPVQLRNERGNSNLIRHMTQAVTSKLCLQPEKESCNVCGLVFYTMWTFFFPGNFFVASCEYVNKLLPPDEFEGRMKDVVIQLIFQRLRSQVTTSFFPDRMDYFGLDRYSIDFWIGSHPSLEPCDLTDKEFGLQSWRKDADSHNTTPPFHWAMAPRQNGAPFDMKWIVKEKVMEDDSLRMREYSFLAGHLSRWYTLYEQGPESFSWVWLAMPDGLEWLRGHHTHGARVVEEVTAQYAVDDL